MLNYKVDLTPKKAELYQPYPKAAPDFELLGVIDQGGLNIGALARNKNTGLYVQLNAQVVKQLDQRKIKAVLGVSNNAGAPKKMESGKRRNMYIDDADFEQLKALGNGNASAGLRALIKDS